MLAVYRKELKSYFTSMIGYVFIAFFLMVIGFYFANLNLMGGYANFEYVLSSLMFLFFILIPVLTMRVVAEERRAKTDQLLLTSPLSVEKIVLGKYLAVASVFLVVVFITLFYPLVLSRYGEVDYATAYAGILGFALLGLAFTALGLFISACTENQVIAAVISFVAILVMNFMSGLAGMLPSDNKTALLVLSILVVGVCLLAYFMIRSIALSAVAFVVAEGTLVLLYNVRQTFFDGILVKFFSWLSVVDRFDSFMNGTIDLASVIYLLSFTFIFLFLAVQSIKKRRWR